MWVEHHKCLRRPINQLPLIPRKIWEKRLTFPSLTNTDPMRSSVSPILPAGGIALSSVSQLQFLQSFREVYAGKGRKESVGLNSPVIWIYPSPGLVAASNSTVSPLPNRKPSLIEECKSFLSVSQAQTHACIRSTGVNLKEERARHTEI
jgi:hypothetical protein